MRYYLDGLPSFVARFLLFMSSHRFLSLLVFSFSVINFPTSSLISSFVDSFIAVYSSRSTL